MKFEFATPGRTLFGAGRVAGLGDCARAFGRRAVLVTGRSPGRVRKAQETIENSGVECELASLAGEPTIEEVDAMAERLRINPPDVVIGMGGGSALDAAKAIAALIRNSGPALEYIEVIGAGRSLEIPALPCIAVPTTAGTGAETTRNAVLGSREHRVKASIRHLSMLPRLALIDPELTLPLPPDITASTGMDALTQLIEGFVSVRANPVTDALCRDGLSRVARALPVVVERGGDLDARTDMALASWLSGMVLANAGLGAVHGFAGPVGGMFPVPHGAVCAALLPHTMRLNIGVLRRRAPGGPALPRFDEIAQRLTGDPKARAEDGVNYVSDLNRQFKIPRLRDWGIERGAFPVLVERASRASSMRGNPLILEEQELAEILESAW